jgi:Fic family protein
VALHFDAFAAAARLEGVPAALQAARDGIDASLGAGGGLQLRTPDRTGESLLRGAAASAALEGSGSSLEDLRSGRSDEIGAAAVRLSVELLGLVRVWRTVPLQALARMHAVAAAGDDPGRGRPRGDAQAVARVTDLARRLTASTSAPGLAVAALVHAELMTVRPFTSRNGLVARAAERLVLVSRGVDPASLTVPEAGHQALGDGYARGLAGYARGDSTGVRDWLLQCAAAYVEGTHVLPPQR